LNLLSRGLLGISGFLGVVGLARFLSFKPDPPPPTRFEVGSIENFPLNTPTVVPTIPAVITRSGDEINAVSLICTHLGCTAELHGKTLTCLCHGSQYTIEGQVSRGPASSSLPDLKVETTKDGNLVIYKGA
jgi:Rieske Fe-S protein